MKKIINYSGIPCLILMAALFFLPVSCNKDTVKDNPNADNSSQLIKVSGEDAGEVTKTTLNGLITSWVITTDKVGIYSADARTATSGGTAIVNAQFTAASSAVSSTFNGTMYWGAGTATPHTFYAYYPYAGSAGSPAATAVPVSLATSQVQASANSNAHIGALDFLVATPKIVTSPANTDAIVNEVNLRYNHVFTLLEFNLKLASGSNTALLSIELYSTDSNLSLTSGTINLTQDTPSGDNSYTLGNPVGTKKVTLTTSGCNLSTGTAISAYMMILPGNQVESTFSDMTIKVTSAAGVTVLVKTGINFVRGKRYTIDLSNLTFAAITPADGDGNTYNTVTIGSQVWMTSNLNTSKYNDGTTAIPNVTDPSAWAGLSTGAYCDYDNTPSNSTTYGKLYNWYAVNTAKLCPTGWHVPTDTEWTTLTDYLGGLSVAGGKLKEAGTAHWPTPNTGATNEVGFTALPGGYRATNGTFFDIGYYGHWWSSPELNTNSAWYRTMHYNLSDVSRYSTNQTFGFSVRCLRGL